MMQAGGFEKLLHDHNLPISSSLPMEVAGSEGQQPVVDLEKLKEIPFTMYSNSAHQYAL